MAIGLLTGIAERITSGSTRIWQLSVACTDEEIPRLIVFKSLPFRTELGSVGDISGDAHFLYAPECLPSTEACVGQHLGYIEATLQKVFPCPGNHFDQALAIPLLCREGLDMGDYV